MVCFATLLFLLVYLCANVELQGLLAVSLPAQFAMSLGPAELAGVLSAPAAHLHPSYWSG